MNSSNTLNPWVGHNDYYKHGHTIDSLLEEGAVQCQICGVLSHDLSKHVRKHDLTAAQYKSQYQSPTRSEKYNKSTGFKSGKENPAYNHGGKFSKWSKNFIHGYDEEAHAKFLEKQKEQVNSIEHKKTCPFFIEYWIEYCDGDVEKAKKHHSQSQTRDLNWFIEKFGEEEGRRRHKEKINNWIVAFDKKSEEELERIAKAKLTTRGGAQSPNEIEVIEYLRENGLEPITQLGIARKDEPKKKFYYDIVVDNKIIEVHGDYYHANPKFYSEDHKFRGSITAKSIWEKDEHKKNLAIENGYRFHCIWVSDLQKNKNQVLEECLNFLKQ